LRAFGIEPKELAVLEGHLDPEIRGDPSAHKVAIVLSVPVEEPPHALRELRFRALDVLPRRHAPNISFRPRASSPG
jgi:hypothetical protein